MKSGMVLAAATLIAASETNEWRGPREIRGAFAPAPSAPGKASKRRKAKRKAQQAARRRNRG